MERKYDDLKIRRINFTYKGFVDEFVEDDFHLPKDAEEVLNMELDNRDEETRMISDMIGSFGDVSDFYDFDYNGDDDTMIIHSSEIDDLDEIDNGIILRFYSSSEDFEKDNYFGHVIVDSGFVVSGKDEEKLSVVKTILRSFDIKSFDNSKLEEKREIIDSIPVDDIIEKRKGVSSHQNGNVVVINPGTKSR